MPWKEVSRMSLRTQFVQAATLPDANISQLASRFGISRPTAYKWLRRALDGEPVAERSRKPLSSPARTQEATERLILEARERFPAWGGRKLRAHLSRSSPGSVLPSPSTITAILRRHCLLSGPKAGMPGNWQRFERPSPNDLWQMDFKGHFGLTDGTRCHPLTVLDDHSRYAVGLVACADERAETVREALTLLFSRHGLPAGMLMDNGPPWGDEGGQPWTKLTAWLIRLGIAVSHGRPYHPQTQGKDERFHRTLNEELLSRHTMTSLADCASRFEDWQQTYNRVRPHESVGMMPPSERYRSSPRSLPDPLPPIVYPEGDEARIVQKTGAISYRNREYRVGKAFFGLPVGLRRTPEAGGVEVRFCERLLGLLDEASGRVVRTGGESAAE